jgi:aspartate 1-decarboxylase
MLLKILKSKIHRATVTKSRLDYTGSIAIAADLMKTVGILPYESVLVADLNNGNRVETYAVPAEAGSGDVVVMGAAAKLIKPKHKVIILSFALMTPAQAKKFKPKIIVLGKGNKIIKRY